jgi:sterol desaturase/sphingolipid hydroxylase (fatty acid hydroxylase superfamily)
MMEWAVTILELLAIVSASAALIFILLMIYALAKKTIKKPERRNEKMTQDSQREGVTFNDIFMFMIAVPLVLLWVGFAGYVIFHGLQDAAVLEQIEGYTTLIAILGGPALLIIKDALDVWKQEQAEKTAFYKMKAQSVIDYNAKAQEQAQMIEAKQQEHEHKQKK